MSGPTLGVDPVRLPPADLASAFGRPAAPAVAEEVPDRSAGLRSLALGRRPVAAADGAGGADAAPAPVVSQLPVAEVAAALLAPVNLVQGPSELVIDAVEDPAAHAGPGEMRARVDGSAPQTIVVYLPLGVRERLRARHAASQETYTTIVLEAVEATHAHLADLLAACRPAPRPGGLFSYHGKRRPSQDEAHVQVSLRPTKSDVAVLDQLVVEFSAPNRSALVTAALDNYLPPAL